MKENQNFFDRDFVFIKLVTGEEIIAQQLSQEDFENMTESQEDLETDPESLVHISHPFRIENIFIPNKGRSTCIYPWCEDVVGEYYSLAVDHVLFTAANEEIQPKLIYMYGKALKMSRTEDIQNLENDFEAYATEMKNLREDLEQAASSFDEGPESPGFFGEEFGSGQTQGGSGFNYGEDEETEASNWLDYETDKLDSSSQSEYPTSRFRFEEEEEEK